MVVFSSPAPFSREQTTNARLSLSFRSESLSSYAFIIMRNERVLTLKRTYSLLFEFLSRRNFFFTGQP